MSVRRGGLTAIAAWAAACAPLAGCREEVPGPPAEADLPRTFAALPPVAPLAFFERACANCHGPLGMFYEESFFAEPHDDAALVHMVREMLSGPARTELDPVSFESMVAFHRSLRGGAGPYLVVTSAGDDAISGEVSPDSTVSVYLDGKEIPARIDVFEWVASLPSGWREAKEVRIVAAKAGTDAATELELREQSFSHSAAP